MKIASESDKEFLKTTAIVLALLFTLPIVVSWMSVASKWNDERLAKVRAYKAEIWKHGGCEELYNKQGASLSDIQFYNKHCKEYEP